MDAIGAWVAGTLTLLAAAGASFAAILKYLRDGDTIRLNRAIEEKKAELEREKAQLARVSDQERNEIQAHAQTVAGLTSLCNGLKEQLDAMQKVHRERDEYTDDRFKALTQEHLACREELQGLRVEVETLKTELGELRG